MSLLGARPGGPRWGEESRRWPREWVLVVLTLVVGAQSPAAALTGAEVIARMQRSFAKAKTFSAKVEKRFHWAVLDRQLTRRGRIHTRQPDQYRLEMEDGDLVVADGEAIWAYIHQNQQAVVSPYEGDLRTPWEILVEYAEAFAPVAVAETELGGRECYLITLSPRPDATYVASGQVTRMRIWIDRRDWLLLQVEQLETNDDLHTYVLSDHRLNKKLDDDLFRYAPAADVELIDRRPGSPEVPGN